MGLAPMKVFRGHVPDRASLARPKVTLGTFDGVHLGHQTVLRELLTWARATDSSAAAVTFDRRPRDALAGQTSDLITSIPHRLGLLEGLGLDAAIVLTFDKEFAAQGPEDFVRNVLIEQLGATGILLGHDTRFGRNGRGDLDLLVRMGADLGFEARSVPAVEVDGEPVSSTRVRKAIQEGDLRLAERLLGRRVSLLGTVIAGASRGKGMGYPTANLDIHHEVRPPEGVFASRTRVGETWRESVTNIGRAPRLQPTGPAHVSDAVVVETHLLDFDGDLYGAEVEVELVDFLRPEEVFTSPEALARRIARDTERARARLKACGNELSN